MRLTSVILIILLPAIVLADGSELKIGWTGPLTGNSAVLGIDSAVAAQMAVDEANDSGGVAERKIKLVVEDDRHETSKTISAYLKLVSQDKVPAVLMSTYGGYFAASERAAKDGVIVMNPLDCNNEIAKLPGNSFCLATQTESIGNIIAAHIHDNGNSPVAVLHDEAHPFMLVVLQTIKKRLKELNDSIPVTIGYSSETKDFKTHLLKIKSKNTKSLILLGHDPMGQAMREARNIGIKSKFYTVGTITSPGFQELAGDSANGTFVAFWEAPKSKAYSNFVKKFREKVGRAPILELATIPSYDSTKVLIQAMEGAVSKTGKVDVEKMKANLLNLKDYDGISGQITIEKDGVVRTIKEKIYVFKNGKLELSGWPGNA